MKKKRSLIILLVLLFFCGVVHAEEALSELDPDYNPNYYDYVINSYNVDIKVNENNTLNITEDITAYFNESKHGIYRTIPLVCNIKRADGTGTSVRTEVSDLTAGDDRYSTSKSNNNLVVKIGDPYKTLLGEKKYQIKYTYNLGKDTLKDGDEFYFNIIGTEWDTLISGVTFKIEMPKDFDASKIGFSAGSKGTEGTTHAEYSVEGRIITGSFNYPLLPGEGLTIRCELPDGYFVGAKSTFDTKLLLYLIPIICLITSLLLWFKFGKDEKAIPVVGFYPPEGYNSLDIGFLYRGLAENKDVTSLLIYLANEGYIQINEIEEKKLFGTESTFEFMKLKNYEGDDENERLFLNGLFRRGDIVTISDLKNDFYRTSDDITDNINSKENKELIYETRSLKKESLIFILYLLSVLFTFTPTMSSRLGSIAIYSVVFLFVGVVSVYSVIAGKVKGDGGVALVIGLAFSMGPLALVSFSVAKSSYTPLYLIGLIVGILCSIIITICGKNAEKRNAFGLEILGQLEGFKNFLLKVEKDKLELLVEKDPTYFYNILPYTYVLGVSDTWIKKFEGVNFESPRWYRGYGYFNSYHFGRSMGRALNSANTTMMTRPKDSGAGGGGFSGGGSSGGGFGGGGGGSW